MGERLPGPGQTAWGAAGFGRERQGSRGVAKTQRFLKHMLFVSEDAAHCGWARAVGRSAKGCGWEAVPRPVWRALGTMLPLPEGSR